MSDNVLTAYIVSLKKLIQKHYGHDTFRCIFSQLSEADQARLSGILTPFQWVPEEVAKNFMLAAEAVLPSGENEQNHFYDLGREMALNDVPAFLKPFIRKLDVDFLLNITTRIWHMYHTHGDLSAEMDRTAHTIDVALSGYRYSHKPFCHLLAGYMEGILELSGITLDQGVTKTHCVLLGHDVCRYRIKIPELPV